MRVRVKIKGEPVGEWSLDDLELAEAFRLKAGAGLTPMAVERGIPDADPDALRALVWLLRSRTEPGLDINAVRFRLGDFDFDDLAETEGGEGEATPPVTDDQASDPTPT